jgi:hypothetical protein
MLARVYVNSIAIEVSLQRPQFIFVFSDLKAYNCFLLLRAESILTNCIIRRISNAFDRT